MSKKHKLPPRDFTKCLARLPKASASQPTHAEAEQAYGHYGDYELRGQTIR